jgi:hypothetical protein
LAGTFHADVDQMTERLRNRWQLIKRNAYSNWALVPSALGFSSTRTTWRHKRPATELLKNISDHDGASVMRSAFRRRPPRSLRVLSQNSHRRCSSYRPDRSEWWQTARQLRITAISSAFRIFEVINATSDPLVDGCRSPRRRSERLCRALTCSSDLGLAG